MFRRISVVRTGALQHSRINPRNEHRAFCTWSSHVSADYMGTRTEEDGVSEGLRESLVASPESAAEELLSMRDNAHRPERSHMIMRVRDNIPAINTANLLLRLGEFAARVSGGPDYAILDACIMRSGQILSSFSPSELVGLLSLCARLDFVDSDFNEAIQVHLPSVITKFKDGQYPILFASLLRLGVDQPIDRSLSDPTTPPKTLPFMSDLISTMVSRLSNIPETGCLTILHSILKKPRARITPETLQLVHAISDHASIGSWPLHMRVQVMHSLSRFGIDNKPAIESLFGAIDRETIRTIPPQNLQHLISLVYNHAQYHDESLWGSALEICLDRLSQPAVAKTMPLAIIAVTLGYLGRLPAQPNFNRSLKRGFGNLLNSFMTGQTKLPKSLSPKISDRIYDKSINRLVTDSLVDVAHLTGVVEAIDRLGYWDMYFAVPLLLITRRLVLRDGIHNIRAAPLCQLAIAILNGGSGELTKHEWIEIDKQIDLHLSSISKIGQNWSLINEAVIAPSADETVALLLEGLVKHDSYVRTTQSVLDRCAKIKSYGGIRNGNVSQSVMEWLDSLPEKAVEIVVDSS